MANRITMSICGEDYTLVVDESAYMEKVGALVDEKMTQLQEGAHVSRIDAAVLTAVNLADELLKAQEAAENLRRQLKTYLDEASQAKAEASELEAAAVQGAAGSQVMAELLSRRRVDSLVAAVQSGADAVYMGFGAYNARRSAKNFTEEEFAQAVWYCHLRGVRVYLTLNNESPTVSCLERRSCCTRPPGWG